MVESKIEDFVKMRMSQISLQTHELNNNVADQKDSKISEKNNPLKFLKDPNKEIEFCQKMTEKEQIRLYTRLCVENDSLQNENKALKTEYIILQKQNNGVADEELQSLKKENATLRVRLNELSRELGDNMKVNRKDVVSFKKKTLVKTVGKAKTAGQRKVQFVCFLIKGRRIEKLSKTGLMSLK